MAFSSSAEPLLNPDLPEMLRIAKHLSGGRIVASVTTNATLLDEAWAHTFVENDLDAIEISMDGATRETYEGIRRGACFETVVENVRRLTAMKRSLKSLKPHVSLRFVLCRDNVHEVEPFLDLADGMGVSHVVVNGLEPYRPRMADKVLYGPDVPGPIVELFGRLQRKAVGLGMRLDLPSLVPDAIDDCTLIAHSCIVLRDGSVTPCSPLAYPRPFFYLGERLWHPQVVFGNIQEESLGAIWRSDVYRAFRDDLREGRIHDCCTTCLKRAGVLCPLKHWEWLPESKATGESAPERPGLPVPCVSGPEPRCRTAAVEPPVSVSGPSLADRMGHWYRVARGRLHLRTRLSELTGLSLGRASGRVKGNRARTVKTPPGRKGGPEAGEVRGQISRS